MVKNIGGRLRNPPGFLLYLVSCEVLAACLRRRPLGGGSSGRAPPPKPNPPMHGRLCKVDKYVHILKVFFRSFLSK